MPVPAAAIATPVGVIGPTHLLGGRGLLARQLLGLKMGLGCTLYPPEEGRVGVVGAVDPDVVVRQAVWTPGN